MRNYYYTITEKSSNIVLCEKGSDLEMIKAHVSEALFEYLTVEARNGRLNAVTLRDDNVSCKIDVVMTKKAS